MRIRSILAEINRGLLLDILVFVINLGLIVVMTNYFLDVIRRATEDEADAQFVLLVCALLMFALPAAGAVLKRWHFHERQKQRVAATQSKLAAGCSHFGCLFSWLFYFVLSIFLTSVVMSLLQGLIYGRREMSPALFVPLVIISLVFCVVQTALVYRYFVPPSKPVKPFLRDVRSEQLGDLCIFVNMILFQIFWNIVLREFPTMQATSFSNVVGNLFFLTFIALLIYFPPRIFYLAEDYRRPATWMTMLLANSPTIIRALIGR